jgi:hypothetical protein
MIHGLVIKLENPRDTVRRGKDKNGKAWANTMVADYGYFKSTMAADGDAVDCFIGPAPESEFVVAIDQKHADGSFDETKFVLGVTTRDEGEKLYLAHYPKGWKLGPVSTATVGQLKEWLKNGDTKSPFGGQMVKAAASPAKVALLAEIVRRSARPVYDMLGSGLTFRDWLAKVENMQPAPGPSLLKSAGVLSEAGRERRAARRTDRYTRLKERRGECPECGQPNLPDYDKCTCPKPAASDRTFLPENIEVPEEFQKQAVVKRYGDQWRLLTRDGKRVLGTHPSANAAHRQEYAIQKSQERRIRDAGDDDLDAAEERKFDIVKQLRKAKTLSDRRQYSQKHLLLNRLMADSPHDFYEDSRERDIVGVTHRPSNFRIHIPANKLRAPLAKSASAAQRLMKTLGSVAKQAPLFGEEVAQAARKGVSIHRAGNDPIKGAAQGPLQKLVGLLESKTVQDLPTGMKWNQAENTGGTVVDFVGRIGGNRGRHLASRQHVGKSVAPARSARIADSKIYESRQFPELIGRTEKLEDIAKKHGLRSSDHEGLFAALGREFDGRFIVKPDGGFGTAASSLVHDKKSPAALKSLLEEGLANNQGHTFTNMVAQRRLDLQPINRFERAVNNIGEIGLQGRFGDLKGLVSRDPEARKRGLGILNAVAGGQLPMKAKGSATGGVNKEFRVHVVDGKVVPYATVGRGSVLGTLPIRTPNAKRAEQALQEKLKSIDPGRLQGTWAFDVAKGRNADKGFHVIETNPSVYASGSGYMSLPHVRDAVAGALQGRVPRYILAQKGVLAGAAGAGAAAAAT